jgi:hypothetical protein
VNTVHPTSLIEKFSCKKNWEELHEKYAVNCTFTVHYSAAWPEKFSDSSGQTSV